MLKMILNWGVSRVLAPLFLQIIQVTHSYHTMDLAIGQILYIVMYCTAAMVIFSLEVAIESNFITLDKDAHRLFIASTILTGALGIGANIYCFQITHPADMSRDQYWVGMCGIILISLLFEILVKLVIKAFSKGKHLE
jgi:hypothetical protein